MPTLVLSAGFDLRRAQIEQFVAGQFKAQLVELVCGDSRPHGTGFKEVPVKASFEGLYPGREQALPLLDEAQGADEPAGVVGGPLQVDQREAVGLGLHLREDAPQLFAVQQKIVGPFDASLQARKLKDLEKENLQLKKLVADLSLDNAILKEVLSKK